MRRISGILLSCIFAVLGLLHAYWACGGRRGWEYVLPSQGGRPSFIPTPPMIWSVALACLMALGATTGRMGAWGRSLPSSLFRWAMRGISVLFVLRAVGDFRMVGLFKTQTNTPFALWDAKLFSPLCIVIAGLAALTDAQQDSSSTAQ